MPEKELIVYLPAGPADLAILEPVEFHQIILIVVLIGAVAAVCFSIFYWLLKKLICSKSAQDARAEKTPLLAYQYRGHIIRFEVEQNPDTLYWEARGVIELIEGKTSRTIIVNGAINTFKTEAEAKHAFLQQAKRWIYDQIGS